MTALYLKYRPKNLDELDLTEARESLIKIAKSGKVPHAFLFSGPKGTGKTSAARIIAKIVNCEKRKKNSINPCTKCDSCKSIEMGSNLDVIEMDAASNRGIDDVRALREAVKLSPSRSEKKIYIIDEAHMLTTEASNALLKTLEEPPEHVIFILATTNPEKLITTVRSRVTNIIFSKASTEEVLRCLARVIKGERLKTEKEALEIIAKSADGSFRDAIKVIEQLVTEGAKFTGKEVEKLIYGGGIGAINKLFEYLEARDKTSAVKEVERNIKGGLSIETYIQSLLESLQVSLLAKVGVGEDNLEKFSQKEIISLIRGLGEANSKIRDALIEQLPLEIAVIEWIEKNPSEGKKPAGEERKLDPKKGKSSKTTNGSKKDIDPVKTSGKFLEESAWQKILAGVKPKNTSTEALLRAAKPLDFDGKNLTIGVFYSFHKERLENGIHRQILEETIESVIGTPVSISCTLTEPPPKKIMQERKEAIVLTEGGDEDIIRVAKEIFGN